MHSYKSIFIEYARRRSPFFLPHVIIELMKQLGGKKVRFEGRCDDWRGIFVITVLGKNPGLLTFWSFVPPRQPQTLPMPLFGLMRGVRRAKGGSRGDFRSGHRHNVSKSTTNRRTVSSHIFFPPRLKDQYTQVHPKTENTWLRCQRRVTFHFYLLTDQIICSNN